MNTHLSTATMPSDITGRLSWFDRFATRAAALVAKPQFFAFCVLLVLIWAPSFLVLPSIDTWQLVINTATTIITFLMVALLQNTQDRADAATQHKLNAIADGLADLMTALGDQRPGLHHDVKELRDAVGLEDHEGSR
ncbi:low affinity iron permease family protein [Nocardia thailandica]|uniref:low affinity iron permease family protein n=1 Tax=Nocardia thailandica TaxID=257275 RepID=UPI000311B3CE|nr:low affinity iron permease family protein [Nocardia thailandica]